MGTSFSLEGNDEKYVKLRRINISIYCVVYLPGEKKQIQVTVLVPNSNLCFHEPDFILSVQICTHLKEFSPN